MEPNLSLKHPQSWVTDVAIAEFDEPLRLKHYRVLDWDRNELSPQERIFLIDGEREGVVEPYKSEVSDKIEGMLGGRRYYTAYENTQTTYRKATTLIWRTSHPTLGGYSGSALLRAGKLLDGDLAREWHIIAFQSHEYNAMSKPDSKPPMIYWKIAFQPPTELKKFYPVVTHGQVHKLDQIYINRYHAWVHELMLGLQSPQCGIDGRLRAEVAEVGQYELEV
jgi:hypothetical protein